MSVESCLLEVCTRGGGDVKEINKNSTRAGWCENRQGRGASVAAPGAGGRVGVEGTACTWWKTDGPSLLVTGMESWAGQKLPAHKPESLVQVSCLNSAPASWLPAGCGGGRCGVHGPGLGSESPGCRPPRSPHGCLPAPRGFPRASGNSGRPCLSSPTTEYPFHPKSCFTIFRITGSLLPRLDLRHTCHFFFISSFAMAGSSNILFSFCSQVSQSITAVL